MIIGNLEVEIGANTSGLKKAEGEVKATGKKMEKSFNGVGDAIRAALTIEAARRILMIADNMGRLESQVKRLTRTTGDFEKVWARIEDTSNANGQAIANTTALFQRFQGALKGVADSNDEVLDFVDTLQKLGTIGGSSAEELSNALTQLSQGFSAGVIRAEEYNSVIEQAPEVLKSAAKNIKGIDGDLGKLRQAMLDGKLTADTFFQAVMAGSKDTNEEFNLLAKTAQISLVGALNSVSKAILEMDKVIGTTKGVSFLADAFSNAAENAAHFWRSMREGTEAQITSRMADISEEMQSLNKDIEASETAMGRFKNVMTFSSNDAEFNKQKVSELKDEYKKLQAQLVKIGFGEIGAPKVETPEVEGTIELGLGATVSEKDVDKDKKLRVKQQVNAQEMLDGIYLASLSNKSRILELEKSQLLELGDMYKEGLISYEDYQKAVTETTATFAKERGDLEVKVVEETSKAYDALARNISDNLASALTGAQSWADSMRAIMTSVLSQFIEAGITSAFGGSTSGNNIFGDMFSTGGGRAMGGNTSGQLAHPINERGDPEILNQAGKQYLLPTGRGGTITPMGSGGGGGQPNISMINNGTPMNIEAVQIDRNEIMIMIRDENKAYDKALTAELASPNSRKSNSLRNNFRLEQRLR